MKDSSIETVLSRK